VNKTLAVIFICTFLYGCQFENKDIKQIIEKVNAVEEQNSNLQLKLDELEEAYATTTKEIIQLAEENEKLKVVIQNNEKNPNPLDDANKEAILKLSESVIGLSKDLDSLISHVNKTTDFIDYVSDNSEKNSKRLKFQQELIDSLDRSKILHQNMIDSIAIFTGMKN
jgi:septal ring factor EnvC (AmiA/AmiB activator)